MAAIAVRTLLDIVKLTSTYLGDHGSTTPRLDAELLVAHALGLRRIDLYLQFDRIVDEEQLAAIRTLVRRRSAGEPIAYLTGTREFFSRSFEVTPDVLVPRPETETLVAGVLDELLHRRGATVADLGTGSGCIAVTLAAERDDLQLIATDISEAALAVAHGNAARHGVDGRVRFAQGSWGSALDKTVDVVVSNPPYITTEEMAHLPSDVAGFEPRIALDAGADGLDSYRHLMASLPGRLGPGGLILLEVDPRRAAAVAQLISATFDGASARIVDDLSRRARVVVASLGEPAPLG
jgi:release factor glutamine methyltransferase